MRVLHCIPSMAGGGAERQLTYLARGLREFGCDVHVALQHEGSNLPALYEAGATIHRIGLRRNHDIRLLTRLRDIISTVQPDLVQCWLTQMQVAGGAAAMLARRPWIFSERSSGGAYPPCLKNALRSRVGAVASAIVSNSAVGDQYWAERAGRRVRRYVIPNGLPLQEIAAVAAASPAELGLEAGEALVLFAGRLDEMKNPGTFVQAISRIRSTFRLRARMCGEGPESAVIAQLIEGLGLHGRVEMTGYTPYLWRLIKRASVLVSTSLCEGHPNVVLEAMACGCPLVVSDIPAHREFLDDDSAVIVPVGDAVAVARGIERVLERPIDAVARARVALRRAESYSSLRMAQRYAQVYADVLSTAGRSATAAVEGT